MHVLQWFLQSIAVFFGGAATDAGSVWDPNGSPSPQATGTWDPNG
jgi:hypothetical protein